MARFQSNVHWRVPPVVELGECSMLFYYAWLHDCSQGSGLDVRKQSKVGKDLAEMHGFSFGLRPEDVAPAVGTARGIGKP
jgi:hypothetical protein